MRKIFKAVVSVCMASAAAGVNAEVLINDSFDYPVGDLYSNSMWIKYGATSSNPVQIVENNLVYKGYEDSGSGNAVRLGNDSGSASEQALFRGKDEEPLSAAVYYSALISVDELPSLSKSAAFLCLTGANSSDPSKFGDAVAGSEGGGLFAKVSDNPGYYRLGISRNVLKNGNTKTTIQWSDSDLSLNETYLVVVKYEKIEGANNDRMWLWINPAAGDDGTMADVVADEGDTAESLADVRGIEIRQGSCPAAKIPGMLLDEVRVATSWGEIFNPGEGPVDVPVVKLSEVQVSFDKCYQGVRYVRTINVKGENLKGDIEVKVSEPGEITVTDGIIPRQYAESVNGFDIDLELTVADIEKYTGKIIFESEGAQSKTLSVSWRPVETIPVSTLKELYDEDSKDMNTLYRYTGDAVVTYVDTYYDKIQEAETNSLFVQDGTAAVEIRSAAGCGYDEIDVSGVGQGDILTGLIGNVIFSDDSGLYFIPVYEDAWTVASTGNAVIPEPMTLEQMRLSDPSDIMFRLVTVKNVKFDGKYMADPDFYDKFNSQKYKISDDTESGWLWAFNGADYKNQPTTGYFDKTWSLTGICYEIQPQVSVAPRSFADFCEQTDSGSDDAAASLSGSEVLCVYDVYGRKVDSPGKGVFILYMSDGSCRKVIYQ